jgi:N-acetyl-anhydromuramyl-L-alanine amidase AmpD
MTAAVRHAVAFAFVCVLGAFASVLGACATNEPTANEPAVNDAIVIAGRRVPLGAPVVLWSDPGGFDAYRRTRFFRPEETLPSRPERGTARPERFDVRSVEGLSPATRERVLREGFDAEALRERVDQFVVHYDVCGTSRRCFEVLHDVRGLSVHFLLDVDGVLYQTLDVRERARHAGAANERSIGVEIAQIGAYRDFAILGRWYPRDEHGRRRLKLPAELADDVRTPGFIGRPARPEPIRGLLHGAEYVQFDYTPEQYRTLARLLAVLSREFPGLRLEAPRDAAGGIVARALTPEERSSFRGVLGHWHVSASKQDPGPAFDWEAVLGEARRIRDAAADERAR